MDVLGVVVRFGLYLDLTLAFGVAASGLMSLRGAERVLPLRATLATTAIVGAVFSVAGLFVLAASMAGTSLLEVDRETVGLVVSDTAAGAAWKVRMLALVAAVVATLFMKIRPRAALGTGAAASGIALATLAWTGHGAMDEGNVGWLHLSADIVHLLSAGAWVGALFCLSLLSRQTSLARRRGASDAHARGAGWVLAHREHRGRPSRGVGAR